ncbi:MAG: M81 family metallopeptidase, partial [bacterium]
MSKPRVIIGMMSHETNTFSTVKTTLDDFKPMYGKEIIDTLKGTRSGIGGYIYVFERENIEYIPTIAATATPAGELRNKDYWYIVNYITDEMKKAGKIDGVLLALHGAMVAQDVPEAEGTLLNEVKKIVGNTPVIITLDLHGLISDKIINNCEAVFGYDTNPHIDMYERGVEAAETIVKTIRGKIKPTVAYKKLPMLPPTINQRTTEGPMVKLLKTAWEMENQPGVINVCLFPAFPYADVQRVGSAVVAVTDNNPEQAQRLANELGDQM